MKLVSVRVSVPVSKAAWEERVNSAYTFTLLFITEGSQSRNSSRAGIWGQKLMQGPQRVLLTGLLLMACSACFLIESRTTSPGMAPPTMGWALPCQSLIREMNYKLAYRKRLPLPK